MSNFPWGMGPEIVAAVHHLEAAHGSALRMLAGGYERVGERLESLVCDLGHWMDTAGTPTAMRHAITQVHQCVMVTPHHWFCQRRVMALADEHLGAGSYGGLATDVAAPAPRALLYSHGG